MSSNSNRPNPPGGVRGYKPEDLRTESFSDVDGLRVAAPPIQKGAVNIFFKKARKKNLPTNLTAVTFTVLMCNSLSLNSCHLSLCVCVRECVCEIKIQKLLTSIDISRLTGVEPDRVQQLTTV